MTAVSICFWKKRNISYYFFGEGAVKEICSGRAKFFLKKRSIYYIIENV